ncbi:hypothetical protein QYE76_010968 [Lolium multiflorum]|uniref:Uncharacterized protein n=1 Tax=Lolium multiflorum TaxID=4521 RepID=A0AAD8TW23_LOLMU|nr:hypothetical protein QYE76_010968 [Lolium multiflorum]
MSLVLGHRFLIRPPPTGVFAALVYSQCPRLQNLSLLFFRLVNDSDVSISSASLRRLRFYGLNTRHLNVAAPNLQVLRVSLLGEVHVAAPNLAELASDNIGHFVFAEAVRNLRRLEAADWSAMAPLMRRFDTVDELRLHADVVRMHGLSPVYKFVIFVVIKLCLASITNQFVLFADFARKKMSS